MPPRKEYGGGPPVSYTDPGVMISGSGSTRTNLWSRGSDSMGQLTVVRGNGTNASPYEGFVYGWCGGTGQALAASNRIHLHVPRGPYNWLRITSVVVMPLAGMGCDFAPVCFISDGGGNISPTPIGETKIATTSSQDPMVWSCDIMLKTDMNVTVALSESMGNMVAEAGSETVPCIQIWTAGFAAVATLSFTFMVQLEWVEL